MLIESKIGLGLLATMARHENWLTDADLFASLHGGAEIISWFGHAPSFHDATLKSAEFQPETAILTFLVFRITNETDDTGFLVLDRHAVVTVRLEGVTAIDLRGCVAAIVDVMRVRQIEQVEHASWNCSGPEPGNYEIDIISTYGLQGKIYARDVKFSLKPNPSPD